MKILYRVNFYLVTMLIDIIENFVPENRSQEFTKYWKKRKIPVPAGPGGPALTEKK